ncbi:MAG: hypothetical protein JOZ10_00180 [Acidobacteria bacterium]|nr:hypothetical protein [Acidobacteriota bacterium]
MKQMKWKQPFSFLSWWFALVPILLFFVVISPVRARAQFGLDPCCAIITAGLNTISGLLKNVVARPLTSIQQIQQDAAKFEQDIVYPADAINNAHALVVQSEQRLRQAGKLFALQTHSAQLPMPQQLERALFSRSADAIGQIGETYSAVYGPVILPADAPQAVRDLVDMSDAEAQTAFKKAIELDALADVELAAADQISRQIETSAPGTAPILEAEASAWLVRANGYTQSGLAELIRIRSIDLANAGAELKLSAMGMNTLRNNTAQALQHGSR